jgi:hypothetical protein
MMADNQFKDFLKDVEQHGQQTPVVLFEGKVLEGRNRALVVHQLGKELKTVQFEDLDTTQSPLEFVISSNLHRRHLTDEQRVQIATQLAKLLKEQTDAGGTAVPPDQYKKGPAAIAAEKMSVSKRSVNRELARDAARLQYREQIASRLSGEKPLEEFFEKLDQGEILSGPSDLKLFAELPSGRMNQLLKHVLKTATFREAQDREEEEEARKLEPALRSELRKLLSKGLDTWKDPATGLSVPPYLIPSYRDALYKAVEQASYNELAQFIGFTPFSKEDRDRIDREKINEGINVCHYLNKDVRGNEVAKISIKDILDFRAKSIPSGDGQSEAQAPESSKEKANTASGAVCPPAEEGFRDTQEAQQRAAEPRHKEHEKPKPPLSEEGLKALERLIDILGVNQREFLLKFAERDLIDWAFPESVLRIRQIWRSKIATVTRSLRETIKTVDAERLTALNVHDLAAWKSNVARTEEFCFRGYEIGSFFSVSITSAAALPAENRTRFLDIDEAIRRYSREHGHLVNAAIPAAEAIPFEDEISFEEPIST